MLLVLMPQAKHIVHIGTIQLSTEKSNIWPFSHAASLQTQQSTQHFLDMAMGGFVMMTCRAIFFSWPLAMKQQSIAPWIGSGSMWPSS